MKKELILHIGMGKTGTTALQDFFWANSARLETVGICYPTYGSVAHAHHPLSPFLPDHLKNEWQFESVEKWAPKLEKIPVEKILLSSELFAWASKEQIVEFCQCAQEWFRVTAVIYLRRQDNIIMANHNQLVKAGSRRCELDQTWENDLVRFDYWKIIEPWATCLGKSNIIVRPYEKQQFYRGDIRYDFMHHVCGTEVSDKYIMSAKNSNPRLNLSAITYKIFLNKIFLDAAKVAEFNDALLSYSGESLASDGSIFSNQPLLSPVVRNQIIGRSVATNNLIAREYMGREDGVLFLEQLPDNKETWEKSNLTPDEARYITQHIATCDKKLVQLLISAVGDGLNSIDMPRRSAAIFLRASLPWNVVMGQTVGSWNLFLQRRREPESSKQEELPQILFSLQFPAVTVDKYLDEISRKYVDSIVWDYLDRPIGLSAFARNMQAFSSSVHYARLLPESDQAFCVHGHFMPLKYRFLKTNLRKRYVTWVRDPVGRLEAHYLFWKDTSNQKYVSELRLRMLDEDWSFEKFAFCPAIRNVYSKYLWGFPLRLFNFIGIAELYESEMQRFFIEEMGFNQTKPILSETSYIQDISCNVDSDLRQRIEKYHNEDVILYRRALEIRSRKLTEYESLQ